MKTANAEQQLNKLADKVKESLPPVVLLTTPKVVKKEPPVATAIHVLNTSADDGEERVYKCEQEGCFSSFKSRSSLRDHQKGKE